MSFTIENVNGCTRKLVFKFESLDLSKEIKAEVVKKQKSVNLKGFRKGKAPLDMVEKIYGPQVEYEALNQFVQNEFFKAIEGEDMRVVGHPNFENVKYDSGKEVSFDVTVEIFPQFELKDFSNLEFKKESTELGENEYAELEKNYLNSKAEMRELEDEAKGLENGLFAVFNFQGTRASGEQPENMKGSEHLLEIGSGQFIPGFEEGMIGLKKGEKKDIELEFPKDYHAEELQGEKVTFHVELLEIKEKIIPELNDELAKEFGFESKEDFVTKNTENLKEQKERKANETLNQAILEKLVEENLFDVPLSMITQQEKHLKEDLSKNLRAQGFTDPMVEEYFTKWKDDVLGKAEFQVRSGLILDKLAVKFGVEVGQEDLEAKVKEMALASKMDYDQIKDYYLKNESLKNNLNYAIREEKTFEKLYDQVKLA